MPRFDSRQRPHHLQLHRSKSPPTIMLSKIALNAAAVALSALIVSAAPTQLSKRDVSVVTNCQNQNQVALTWDGE